MSTTKGLACSKLTVNNLLKGSEDMTQQVKCLYAEPDLEEVAPVIPISLKQETSQPFTGHGAWSNSKQQRRCLKGRARTGPRPRVFLCLLLVCPGTRIPAFSHPYILSLPLCHPTQCVKMNRFTGNNYQPQSCK